VPSHSDSTSLKYLVRNNGEIQGPFAAEFIEAMILSGVYPDSVDVRKEGSGSWMPFSSSVDQSRAATPQPARSNSSRPPSLPSPASAASDFPAPGRERTKPKKTISGADQFCVAVLTIAVLILVGFFWAVSSKKGPNTSTTDRFASASQSENEPNPDYAAPVRTPKKQNRDTTHDYTPIQPPAPVPKITYDPPVVSKPILDASTLFKDAAGNTYSVPNIEYNRLLMMKSALTPKQVRIDTLQVQQEALGATIARSRRSLDNTDQYQVDDFNRMVNRYNALNEEIEPLINEFNREVDRFNSELERVGTLVR
jgi:hypothetical protein